MVIDGWPTLAGLARVGILLNWRHPERGEGPAPRESMRLTQTLKSVSSRAQRGTCCSRAPNLGAPCRPQADPKFLFPHFSNYKLPITNYKLNVFSSRTNWPLAPNRFSAALESIAPRAGNVLDLTASNPTNIGLRYNSEAILSALAQPEALRISSRPQGPAPSPAKRWPPTIASAAHTVDPERIVLTTSTSEAYSFVFRLLCDPGDEVLVPAPSYPLFEFLADIQDVRLRPYPLFYDHGWHLDMHALVTAPASAPAPSCWSTPTIPPARYVKPGEAEQLRAICARRGLALVVDEVFLDFAHDGPAHPSFVADDPTDPSTRVETRATPRTADLYSQRPLQNRGPAADEVCLDRGQRTRRLASRGHGAAGGDRRHLSLHERAHPACRARAVRPAPRLPAPVDGRESVPTWRNWIANSRAQKAMRAPADGSRLVRRAARAVTRSDEDLAIELLEQKSVLVHPGHFYDFPADGYLVLSLIAPRRSSGKELKGCWNLIGDL